MNGKKLNIIRGIMAAIMIACCGSVHALPEIDEIVSGDVEINVENKSMNINAGENSIINFRSFDIMLDETVRVTLPTENSSILNRVSGGDMSEILGGLDCNGFFILVNEAGIHVGDTARINAGDLILSTRDIIDSDFLSGNYLFKRMDKEQIDRLLLNEGRINTEGVGILIAGAVRNDGIIAAPAGKIVLACGDAVKIDMDGSGLISVAILEEAAGEILDLDGDPITEQIKNTGGIDCGGGMVLLTAESVGNIIQKTINLGGIVKATGVEIGDGVVRLVGDKDIEVTGIVKAQKVEIETETGIDISDQTVETDYLQLTADMFDVKSIADTTHLVKRDGNVLVDDLVNEPGNDLILKGPDFGSVSYSADSNIIFDVPYGTFDAASGIIIPGHEVKISANKIGSYDDPVGINADITSINKNNGTMDISEMRDLGTTLYISGPEPDTGEGDPWGAVSYNKGSHLILDAEKVRMTTPEAIDLYGDITFNNFECLVPAKEIYFEAGRTYTFNGSLDIGPHHVDYPVGMYSSEEGKPWYIDNQSDNYSIQRVAVRDSVNLNNGDIIAGQIYASPSFNRGGNFGWLLNTAYWTGSNSNIWSDPANWDPIGKPGASDDVEFNSTYSANDTSVIDEAFAIASLTIDSSWTTGAITLQSELMISGDYEQDAGTVNAGANQITVGGSWDNSTGTFNHDDNTVIFNGTDMHTINQPLSDFYDLVFSGTGLYQAISDITVDNDLYINDGTLRQLDYDITVKGGSVTGDGLIYASTGTFTVEGTGDFGGNTDWTFYDLTFGDGVNSHITSKQGSNDITVCGLITIANEHRLEAGTDNWNIFSSGAAELISDVTQVSSGVGNTFILKSDGTVWGWGSNTKSQLGDETNNVYLRITPFQIRGVDGVGYLSDISQISNGWDHVLALKSDGSRVYAWGDNTYGQLGNGTNINSVNPVEVLIESDGEIGFLSEVSYISAGDTHNLAVKTSGDAYAWGENTYGQLGDGTNEHKNMPVQIKDVGGAGFLTDVLSVAAGKHSSFGYSMALKNDGTVYAWGKNSRGQLGNGTTSTSYTPVQVIGVGGVGFLTDIIQIDAGGMHSLALKNDGTAYAWGTNTEGELGDGTTSRRTTPIQVVNGMGGYISGVTQVSAHWNDSLFLTVDGSVYACGYNNAGQLGDGTTTDRTTPVQVKGVDGTGYLTDITKISAGTDYVIALKSDGTIYSWGSGDMGALSSGQNLISTLPVHAYGTDRIGFLEDIIQLAAGSMHSLALRSDGTVWGWGSNMYGQLGDGTTVQRIAPVEVSGLSDVSQISAGYGHSLALKDDGTVWGWGWNGFGQLGDGTTTQRTTPVEVSGLSDVSQISAGIYHSLVLKDDGTVWGWGWNGFGQLGDGTPNQRNAPVEVSGLSGVVQVGAGDYHSLAVKDDGTVYAWGYNIYGQLGDGTTDNRNTPVEVQGLSDVSQIYGGNYHSLALKDDGTVYAWGDNTYGQLGTGTTNNSSVPLQVKGLGGVDHLSGIVQMAAGFGYSIALKDGGTVYAWGDNRYGQLGDGTKTNRNVPVQVRGENYSGSLSDITQITTSQSTSLALNSSGTVYGWGSNSYGKLGNKTVSSAYPAHSVQPDGNPVVAQGILDAQTSTFNYLGSYDGYIGVAPADYYNLNLERLEGLYELSGNTTAGNNFGIVEGTLSAGAHTLNIGGDFSSTGIFNPDSGNVNFIDASKSSNITGANIFNDLTCEEPGKKLIFESGSTQTVQGDLVISGTPGGYIYLSSDTPYSKWFMLVEGTSYVDYADVSDLHNLGDIVCTNTSRLRRTVNWNNPVYEEIGKIIQMTDHGEGYPEIYSREFLLRRLISCLRKRFSVGEDKCEIIYVPLTSFDRKNGRKIYERRYLPAKQDLVMERMTDGTIMVRIVGK